MVTYLLSSHLLRYVIITVWLVNGLGAKVFGLVPRHELIVGRILGSAYAELLTLLIGVAEMAVATWIWWGKYPRLTALLQIIVILTMNVLETWLAPDLLLWGPWNLLFAVLFCGLVYLHGFHSQHSRHATT